MFSSNHPTITHPLPSRQFQIKVEDQPSNPSHFKPKFPSILHPINSDYIVETHYQAGSFQNNFELLKKVIIDLAGDKEENCEFDIIVKKRKIVRKEPQLNPSVLLHQPKVKGDVEHKTLHIPQPEKSSVDDSVESHDSHNEEEYTEGQEKFEESEFFSKMSPENQEKNCSRLFGRLFFDLVTSNDDFQNKYLQKNEFCKKIEEIIYPKNAVICLKDFFGWILEEGLNKKYTNLKVFRDIWSWKNESNENWKLKHFKYYLSKLMKIFFEQYAINYIMKSKIHHDNGKEYLNYIQKFQKGIDNPENFNSL